MSQPGTRRGRPGGPGPGHAQRRQRIVEAAASLLAVRGARAVSVRAVAEEMGVHASTLYHYFPSKRALLAALVPTSFGAPANLNLAGVLAHAARSLHGGAIAAAPGEIDPLRRDLAAAIAAALPARATVDPAGVAELLLAALAWTPAGIARERYVEQAVAVIARGSAALG